MVGSKLLPRDISTLPAPQTSKRMLLRGGAIISMDPQIGNLASGDILIEGDRIAAIGPSIQADDAEIVDARSSIVLPGLIDTHRHAWEGQLRRINPNAATLENYCNATHFSYATHYRPRDTYVGNLLTALGCIDAGITTIVDNSHNARSPDHSDAAVEALLDAGIRAVHAPGAPLTGEWDKSSWPADLERLQAKYASRRESLVTLAMMSQIDRDTWAVARRLGLRIVTEFFGAEMAAELPALQRDGLLGADNIFNHCTGVPEAGWEILHQSGVSVNVCPRSDAHYALENGMCAFQIARDYDIKPALSVDNESSYSGDLFMEMRVAFYLQRSAGQGRRYLGHQAVPDAITVQDLLEAATLSGARVAGLGDRTGSLTLGKQADIVMIRTDALNLYPSNNAFGTVVHAAERSNVDTVIIGGRIRKRHGVVLDLNLSRLEAATEESRNHLFEAVGHRPGPFDDSFIFQP
ncbi:amidohydrolase family protein [Sphingomonas sp. CLY1604]|uniref:amidohydrolase family protein n=1 Tax=Sphingomonas sp. CLY1604 TaxID=3457786 RepID=UPI003FD8A405